MRFKELFNEGGGSDAGKLELLSTDVKKARAYGEKEFKKNGKELDKEIPDFDKNYIIAQQKAGIGKTKRKDMPVIASDDVKALLSKLKNGRIDIHAPFYKKGDDPFPEGLSGKEAKDWVSHGMKDGVKEDDVITVKLGKESAKNLKPIQQQIYFDNSIGKIAADGSKSSKAFLTKKSILVASTDNYIIDGHHRFLSAMLVDPDLQLPIVKIDLPISKLLPMALAYGDAIGNKRNK